jgi:NADH:ubiquinone oxidoreductase subunit D
MKNKFLTVLVILIVAAFIYYNKGSLLDKYRTRKTVENRIEKLTGTDVDLKNFFKGVEGVNRDLDDLTEENVQDLTDHLKNLSVEEKEALSELLEGKSEDLDSFLTDILDKEADS